MIWYTMITICERGFLTIGPPILIKLFGVDSGSHVFFKIIICKNLIKMINNKLNS